MIVCDSISAIHEARRYGKPWTAFLEFKGRNDKVARGYSDKWWEITGENGAPLLQGIQVTFVKPNE